MTGTISSKTSMTSPRAREWSNDHEKGIVMLGALGAKKKSIAFIDIRVGC
jgi:hypothetical protein